MGFRYNFYPRPPRGGRPGDVPGGEVLDQFLSTPSARRATSDFAPHFCARLISIHALREEGDLLSTTAKAATALFLSTPSARRATNRVHRKNQNLRFLSTPSARRATVLSPSIRTE